MPDNVGLQLSSERAEPFSRISVGEGRLGGEEREVRLGGESGTLLGDICLHPEPLDWFEGSALSPVATFQGTLFGGICWQREFVVWFEGSALSPVATFQGIMSYSSGLRVPPSLDKTSGA